MAWMEMQFDYQGDESLTTPYAYVESGEEGLFPGPGLIKAHHAMWWLFDEVLAAIRLVKETKVSMPWTVTVWGDVSMFTHVEEAWSAIGYGEPECRLGGRDRERILRVLQNLADGPASSPRYSLALRRYTSALNRSRSEDEIIDLCIALEASVSVDPAATNRGEYLERKSQLLLSKRREKPGTPTIADHYWVRNQIVHATGAKYDAKATASALRADVRRVLLELIERPELIPLILEGGSNQVNAGQER